MESLRIYLNSLTLADQAAFAVRCGTSLGYLRKVLSTGGRLGAELCIRIERESSGSVLLEELRPDVEWGYLASRTPLSPGSGVAAAATAAQGAAHA